MSALGTGLLSGFAGALQAKEDDYRETRTLEKKRTLEEWRLAKEAEYKKMLGDYEYTRTRTDKLTDDEARREHELEKLRIQEEGKNERNKENRESANTSRRLEVKARSDSLRSAATGELLNTLDGLGGASDAMPWKKEKLPKTFPETISALKKWKDSTVGQPAALAEDAVQLLLSLERLSGKTDSTETEFLEWETQWQELMQKFSNPNPNQSGFTPPSAGGGAPGSSRDNPIDATTLKAPPPKGVWVKTPDGQVRQT